MSKVSKEFKDEFNETYREGMYATRKVGTTVLAVVVGLTILGGIQMFPTSLRKLS